MSQQLVLPLLVSTKDRLKESYNLMLAFQNDQTLDMPLRRRAMERARGILHAVKMLDPELYREIHASASF